MTSSAVLVTVEIKEDRIEDFLKAMQDDVTKSRDKEKDPGCLRFDLLHSREQPNKFVFYEAYESDEAAAFHKTTDHYKSWADFKASGGVASQTAQKVETASIGGWAFQNGTGSEIRIPADHSAQPKKRKIGGAPPTSAVLVTVEIKEDRIEDFLKAMEDDVTGSRDKEKDPGCLRFDLLRDKESPGKFVFYEAYIDDDAAAFHKTTSHYKSWADFKASGGVESQSVVKVESASIGEWAFQG